QNVIITHSHEDHLYIDDFATRTEGYIPKQYCPPFTLNLYGNDRVVRLYDECCAIPYNQRLTEVVAMNELFPFEAVRVGRYTVYPLPADHDSREQCYIYLVIENDSNKTLLYAHDTGYLKEECWEFLKDFKLDLVSLDCTFGKIENCRHGHMGLDCAAQVKQRFIDEAITKPETIYVINHFSHNCLFLNHEEIELAAKEYGILVAYDGRTIEV
ncbi:MAG: MBL fold metallo-hydrolase, partial [Oscillospiraceae bacterium]